MLENMQGNCWHCGLPLRGIDYAREGRCPSCQRATHACQNCSYYAASAPGQCKEPMADPVSDKSRSNFCGYFTAATRSKDEQTDAQTLRQTADDLFDL